MYRQILQDRERAVASPEVAALFYSTTFFCNFPLSLFFDEIDVLCAFAFWRVRFFHVYKKSWLKIHSGRPPPSTI